MADARRLLALSMVPELAKEVASQIDAATTNPGPAVANVTAAPTQAEFNALLASLRTAGVIAP